MKAFVRTSPICILLAALGVLPAAAGQKIPEKLTYNLSWTGIPVGKAEQEIWDQGDTIEGKRGAFIWLSDDERRIPVRAQTKVTLGSVTAELTGGSY